MKPRRLQFEALESRRVLSGNVDVAFERNGTLVITGDKSSNAIEIEQRVGFDGRTRLQVVGKPGSRTTINDGRGFSERVPSGVIFASLGAGNDQVFVRDVGHFAKVNRLVINSGAGNDQISIFRTRIEGRATFNLDRGSDRLTASKLLTTEKLRLAAGRDRGSNQFELYGVNAPAASVLLGLGPDTFLMRGGNIGSQVEGTLQFNGSPNDSGDDKLIFSDGARLGNLNADRLGRGQVTVNLGVKPQLDNRLTSRPVQINGKLRVISNSRSTAVRVGNVEVNGFTVLKGLNNAALIRVKGFPQPTFKAIQAKGFTRFDFSATPGAPQTDSRLLVDVLNVAFEEGQRERTISGIRTESLIVRGGDADESLTLENVAVDGTTSIDLGAGDNKVTIVGDVLRPGLMRFTGPAELRTGDGDNTIEIDNTIFSESVLLVMGDGKNRVSFHGAREVGGSMFVGGALNLSAGRGPNVFELVNTRVKEDFVLSSSGRSSVLWQQVDVNGNARIRLPESNDLVELEDSKIKGEVSLDLGDGNDRVLIHRGARAHSLVIGAGPGDDVLEFNGVATIESTVVSLGSGENRLEVDAIGRQIGLVASSLLVTGGDLPDTVLLSDIELRDRADIDLGGGNDVIRTGAGNTVTPRGKPIGFRAPHLNITTGDGDDQITIREFALLGEKSSAHQPARALNVSAGEGDDSLAIIDAAVLETTLLMGDGDNRVDIQRLSADDPTASVNLHRSSFRLITGSGDDVITVGVHLLDLLGDLQDYLIVGKVEIWLGSGNDDFLAHGVSATQLMKDDAATVSILGQQGRDAIRLYLLLTDELAVDLGQDDDLLVCGNNVVSFDAQGRFTLRGGAGRDMLRYMWPVVLPAKLGGFEQIDEPQ